MQRAAQRAADRQHQQMPDFMQQSQASMQGFMQMMVANMQQQREPPIVRAEPPVVHIGAPAQNGYARIRCDKDKFVL